MAEPLPGQLTLDELGAVARVERYTAAELRRIAQGVELVAGAHAFVRSTRDGWTVALNVDGYGHGPTVGPVFPQDRQGGRAARRLAKLLEGRLACERLSYSPPTGSDRAPGAAPGPSR